MRSIIPELRVALMTLLLPLYVAVAFAGNYFGALHSPRPHHVVVAVVGAPAATAPVAHELSTPKGAYRVSELRSVAQARRLVGERKLAAAYVPSSDATPTVIVATAASPSLAGFVEATFRQVAAERDRPLRVADVRPLPPGNATGTPNFFFVVICTLAGFLTVAALTMMAPTLRPRKRLAVATAAAVLAPLIAYLIGGPGYGTFGGPFWTIVAMLAMGALYALTVAAIVGLMQLGFGPVGLLLGSLVFLFLNVPSSGGTVAPQLLPGFWRFLSQFWIGKAALDANRSILYFDVGVDVLKMLAWLAAWAVLLAVPIHQRRMRQRRDAVAATRKR